MSEDRYNKMVEMFGDRLANPEHFPTTFKYQIKILEQEERKTESPFKEPKDDQKRENPET